MPRPDNTAERSLALFLLGLAVFTPPLLAVFSVEGTWLGVPVLYLYVFAAWAVLILLMGLSAAQSGEHPPRPTPSSSPPAADEE